MRGYRLLYIVVPSWKQANMTSWIVVSLFKIMPTWFHLNEVDVMMIYLNLIEEELMEESLTNKQIDFDPNK